MMYISASSAAGPRNDGSAEARFSLKAHHNSCLLGIVAVPTGVLVTSG